MKMFLLWMTYFCLFHSEYLTCSIVNKRNSKEVDLMWCVYDKIISALSNLINGSTYRILYSVHVVWRTV